MTSTSSTDDRFLRIAVPNKGALAQSAAEMLRESGYRQRQDGKELTLVDTDNGVEFFYLRPRDIALYVGEGTLDVGITGRDLLLDSGAKAEEVMGLGFGRSTFRFAGWRNSSVPRPNALNCLRWAIMRFIHHNSECGLFCCASTLMAS